MRYTWNILLACTICSCHSGVEKSTKAEQPKSVTKVNDDNVSKLTYTWSQEDNYSQAYLDKIYLLVEHYIANSKNELLKIHVKNRDQLSYSIEEQSRDDKEYTMIGISTTLEHRVSTIQWLYIEKEGNILYEYDLPNDSLVRFE